MGYTHYWTVKRKDDLRVEDIGRDIALLIENSQVPIVGGSGDEGTWPTITSEEIRFNGVGPEDACETFCYPVDVTYNERHGLKSGFGFCKTRGLPYDEVVAASVMVLKYHLGDDVDIESDGDPDRDEEWRQATVLFMKTFPDRNARLLLPWWE